MEKKTKFGNPLEFDYTKYSLVSVKLFLDCLHLIPAGPTDIVTLIECIDLVQFEGKTTYDSFEVELVERLMNSVLTTKLPLGTELLISIFLAQVDNITDDRYEEKVAERLAKEAPCFMLFADFDMENPLNKQLIAMCVKKRVFMNVSKEAVLTRLLMYGKELYNFAVESLEIYSNYRPDIQSARLRVIFYFLSKRI